MTSLARLWPFAGGLPAGTQLLWHTPHDPALFQTHAFAGQAVSGFQKAREWLVAGRVGLVVQAADGSMDERARFLSGNGARLRGDRAKAVPVVAPLSSLALGAVFSRDHVVHVAIAHGRLAEALGIESNRLLGIAGQDGRMGQTGS